MSVEQKPTVAIKLVRRVLDQDKPPEPVHHFGLTRVGEEVLMEAGYLDLAELKAAIDSSKAGEEGAATVTVYRRLLFSREVLKQLAAAAEQILSALETQETQ